MAELYYQGHGSFRITTNQGTVLYVDPYIGDGYDLPADLILCSHEHHDHTAVDLMPHGDGCKVCRAADLLQNGDYKTIAFRDITCRAVQAYNKNHPKDQCVGFVLNLDGIMLYAAGDTSETEDMHTLLPSLHLDYALLPGDGIYNMDIPEASSCAKIIGAKHSIPIHLKPERLFSRERAEAFDGPGKIILEPGETLKL